MLCVTGVVTAVSDQGGLLGRRQRRVRVVHRCVTIASEAANTNLMNTPRLPQPSATSQPTILVVGAHRSGTSVTARMINLMGAVIGASEDMLPAHPDNNPAGYWERTDIVIEHERFLQRQGFGWSTVANFAIDKIGADQRELLVASLRRIVATIACPDAPLVVKDPRLCLLLPIWQRVASEPIHVFMVRDPRKIAASLMAAYPTLFTTDFLLALWQKYTQAALLALRDKPVMFVSYAQLMEHAQAQHQRLWQGLFELGATSLTRLEPARLRALLDGRLDRSEPSWHARLSGGQGQLFEWLRMQCQAAGPVIVADDPIIEPADAVLLELEKLRRFYVSQGVKIAQQRDPAVAQRFAIKGH
jgi:hypothetical protein